MTSATPRRDALEAWIRGGRTGPIIWPEERWPDPESWSDPDVRAAAVIAMCASGAPAELPVRFAVINGQRIPAPPSFRHGPRHRAPRPRKVRTP